MKRKRFSQEQFAFALRQAESGTTIEEKAYRAACTGSSD